tara:strand:+ start:12250 stop:12459 length:210 start_codon:yes stop_codon:yes gene_type:complete
MSQFAQKKPALDARLVSELETAKQSFKKDGDDLKAKLEQSGLPPEHASFFSEIWLRNSAFSNVTKKVEV